MEGRHRDAFPPRASEVRFVREDEQGDRGKETPDLGEELPLVVERVAAGLRGIEEEEDSVRDVGERRDRLALHRVPLRHRSIEEARGVEDLETLHRSEEHTSELQSHHDLVCRLLLEKKTSQDT